MSKFTDALKREWTLDLNIATVSQIERETGVSIYKLLEDKHEPLKAVLENPPVLAHVCYIASNAAVAGVDHAGFASGLKGDSLESMSDAFLAELAFFFPDQRRRDAITKMTAAGKRAWEKVMRKMEADVNATDFDKIAEAALTTLLKPPSTNSPESAALTPAH